jgi:hypothetical protein
MGISIAFAIFAMTLFVLVDISLIAESQIRNLGRARWILVVVFLPLLGSIFWLTMGRQYVRRIAATGPDSPQPPEVLSLPDTNETPAELGHCLPEIEYLEKQDKIRELEQKLRERKQLP